MSIEPEYRLSVLVKHRSVTRRRKSSRANLWLQRNAFAVCTLIVRLDLTDAKIRSSAETPDITLLDGTFNVHSGQVGIK